MSAVPLGPQPSASAPVALELMGVLLRSAATSTLTYLTTAHVVLWFGGCAGVTDAQVRTGQWTVAGLAALLLGVAAVVALGTRRWQAVVPWLVAGCWPVVVLLMHLDASGWRSCL